MGTWLRQDDARVAGPEQPDRRTIWCLSAVINDMKAAEDSRTPKPCGRSHVPKNAVASWSAAVLCRFSAYRELVPLAASSGDAHFSSARGRAEPQPYSLAHPASHCLNSPVKAGQTIERPSPSGGDVFAFSISNSGLGPAHYEPTTSKDSPSRPDVL